MPKKKRLIKQVYRNKYLILLSLPAFVFFLVFAYLPMGGVVMAFQNFKINLGFFNSEYVGLQWFIEFVNSYYFWRLLRNTVLLSVYGILTGLPIAVLFALLLNEVRNSAFKKTIQSISYFPFFVSTVVVVGIMINLLNPVDGIVNVMIRSLGGSEINFLNDSGWFRFIYTASGVWQGFGWNAIIFFGAISAIDPTLYEAAVIDGAGRFNRVRYITLPGILPVFITVLLLAMANLLNVGFEKIILMYSPITYETADVISTYVYRIGLQDARYSFASAVGVFNSVVNTCFILSANYLSKKLTGVYLW